MVHDADQRNASTVRLTVEVPDASLVSSLVRWIERLPGARTERSTAPPRQGELGTVDIVIAIISSSGVAALIQTLPEFLRAKRSPITIKLRRNETEVEVSASSMDDVSTMVDKLLKK
ncbi:hypothetical protein OWR29_26480 [Actinoplanes sp. Pm04-4]|uniref:Uncharacterized protein n=1 Tax=Paractinoplanes pyxinae TaxID=2997416 RepID=A0ABT4B4Y7_9ACTN|nr:hypothetical protein [Actinoplanes pyxinae]MCY1141560.1 hypothetical protein [Actinoplanes pyxinae]